MDKKRSRFRQLESLLTLILYGILALFIGFLVTAGMGYVIAKVILAILTISGTLFCLWMLLRSQELFRSRAAWLSCAFISVMLLTIVSLICNFPAP